MSVLVCTMDVVLDNGGTWFNEGEEDGCKISVTWLGLPMIRVIDRYLSLR